MITFETVKDGDIEQCRELCDDLMAFQKSKAVIAPEAFDGMSFDTRMRASYESAAKRIVVIAKDTGKPIGYVFATLEDTRLGDKSAAPDWAPSDEPGFYPAWVPATVGCLNHLYINEGYRGKGVGRRLLEAAIEWLEGFPEINVTFVYISNGNTESMDFYLQNGFTYSHEVFGGFIQAAYKRKAEKK